MKYSCRISLEVKWEKSPHFLKALGGMGKCPKRCNTPLGGVGTRCSHPKHQHCTQAAQNPVKAFLASEQEGVCSRYQCPRKKVRGNRKRGLDTNVSEESKTEVGDSFSSAQVADDKDGCCRLDEGSSHFQLNLPSPWWPCADTRGVPAAPVMEQVLDPAYRMEGPALWSGKCSLQLVLSGGSLSPLHLGLSTLQP